ncbi:hypothetical protein [Mycoplasmopsis opalescens]|uniref:hypothetical protein n=1 Tax=Mycoplasmopsis opalescens TaxID=114886 RepID=UPI0004A7693A|nr:hypothetical protein [Mycoplasmopsis opalescens]
MGKAILDFNENGKLFQTIWIYKGIKIIEQINKNIYVPTPLFSRQANDKYLIIKNSKIKTLVFFGENNYQEKIIHFDHFDPQKNQNYHIHNYSKNGIYVKEKTKNIEDKDIMLVKEIAKKFKLEINS